MAGGQGGPQARRCGASPLWAEPTEAVRRTAWPAARGRTYPDFSRSSGARNRQPSRRMACTPSHSSRATDNFHELFISRKDGRKNPHITSIIERRNGDLWIATSGQGAISLKKNSNPASFHIETELTDRIGSNYLNVIFEDSRQNLWIATEEKGLYRYSPESKELKSYKAPYHIAGDDVSAICEDAHGQIFVGTLTKGLFRLSSRQEGNFEPVLYQTG